jgi:hypothetical protein
MGIPYQKLAFNWLRTQVSSIIGFCFYRIIRAMDEDPSVLENDHGDFLVRHEAEQKWIAFDLSIIFQGAGQFLQILFRFLPRIDLDGVPAA